MEIHSDFFDWTKIAVSRVLEVLSRKADIGIVYEIEYKHFFLKKISSFFKDYPQFFLIKPRNLDASLPRFGTLAFKLDFGEYQITASAFEEDWALLFNKTSGEFLERVSSYLPLDLWKKVSFKKEDVGPFLDGKKIKVKKVLTLGNARIPAEDIYWGLVGHRKNSTTSGTAGHFNYAQALINAWLELVERDSFLVHWLNTISPQRISLENFFKVASSANVNQLKELIEKCKRYKLEVYFLDITSDIKVPVCCAVIISRSSTDIKVTVGASAGFDAAQILLSSLREALSVLTFNYKNEPFYFNEQIPKEKQNIKRKERLSQVFSEKNFNKVSFLIENSREINVETWIETEISTVNKIPSRADILSYLKKIFSEKKKENNAYSVYSFNLENSLISFFNYKVIRVICYGLYPLFLDEKLSDLNHPRLKEFVHSKGYGTVAKINTWPHLFP